MDNRWSDNNRDEEKNENNVLSHKKLIEHAAKKDKRKCHKRYGKHHEPLGVEYITFEQNRNERPKECYKAKNGKGY